MEIFNYKDNILHVEESSLSAIAQKYGTPTYVYSRSCLEQHFNSYQQGFGATDHLICYAVKANSNLSVLKLLVELGAGFDIVSGGELARVLAVGATPEKIVFSGVGKKYSEIVQALDAGILCFNIESTAELVRLAEIARAQNSKAPFSLRVNPDVDAQTHPYIATGLKENKFGIEIAKARDIYLEYADHPHLKIVGIDCHIGSQITTIAPFQAMIEKILLLQQELSTHGIKIEHLDFGGGLGINYNDDNAPTPFELAQLLSTIASDARIIIEPGRSLIGQCGVFLTTVEYLKHGTHKNFCVVDGAMNDLARPSLYNAWHQVLPVIDKSGRTEQYDIVGPVCESADFLAKERNLYVESGDVLAAFDVGAYGFSMSSNYNTRPRAAEIMVAQDEVKLIRERETVPALLENELTLLDSNKTIEFCKMHGLGNDFMVIDATTRPFTASAEQIRQWARRNFGIGFDQLLLVEKSEDPAVDFNYRIFNADGQEVEQCGNGARCFARFVYDRGLTAKKKIVARTKSGTLTLEIIDDNSVKVNMGAPEFNPDRIPLQSHRRQNYYQFVMAGKTFRFMAVNIGNPHAVIIVKDVAQYPVVAVGSKIEPHVMFPQKVNVGFMQIVDQHTIKLRVFERGSGETLACGSGACAAVVCGIAVGKLETPVKVSLPGGDLLIEWQGYDVFMTGATANVFQGKISYE